MTIEYRNGVYVGSRHHHPPYKLEVQGTASASNLLTIGGLQVAGGASQSYSRFGTNSATNSALSAANDLLISGDLEVDGFAFFDGGASVSGNFEFTGVIKAADGTAPAPSYTFENDTNTGLYRVGNDVLGITTAGVHAAQFLGQRLRQGHSGWYIYRRFDTSPRVVPIFT